MNKLIVSSSPHIKSKDSTSRIMLDVLIALLPITVAGAIIFGLEALLVVGICVVSSVLSEFVFNIIVKKEQTVGDFSAAVTGLILALNLPARADAWWQCIIGSVFAIIVVKCLFGGLGCNFANPAATARVFLLISFTGALGGGNAPLYSSSPELVSGATPLEVLTSGGEMPSITDMLLGLRGGAIGETCIVAILIGFIYLVVRRVIHFETPLVFIATVFVLSLIVDNSFYIATYQILSGGLIFAAVFMVTDYVSTPITRSGKMIFAVGCGLITFLIRYYGNYPEGVSFSILLMNILSPYIEKLTSKRPLGGKKA
ncbi:MAG: RnfABCDGE type electron transport complex subunit D [Clostridia bacterium]|nr:RnfABCDGE type electron transport complex subunit D [Clostridia bacterium]